MGQSYQSLQKNGLKIIAGIPAYNEAEHVNDVICKTLKHTDEVIVVDDGSTDKTIQIAEESGAIVIVHSENRGYGEAIKSCFEVAKSNAADILVILDGDGQHNPNEIPRLLEPILRGEADMVIGSRFITNEHNMPKYRKFGIRIITLLWNFGSRVKVSDAQSGFRAQSRKVFEILPLSEKGMSISIEILEKARRKRVIIKEVPISCSYVPSTLNPKAIRHGLAVALSVFRIRLKFFLRR